MPLPASRLVRYDRLVTPREHLSILVEPPAEQLRTVLRDGAAADAEILDSSLATVRAGLRAELGLRGPVIAAGHQAEFFHAGVLAKNIAVTELAARHGGQAVFVVVDSDVPKTGRVSVPQATARGLRRVDVEVPGCELQLAYEAQPARPRSDWLQFFASLTSLAEGGDQSLLPTYARAWLTTDSAAPAYCEAWMRAQAAAEEALGVAGLRHLRLAALCETSAFRCFTAYLALHAERSAAEYNAAQESYRRRHRVRARGRPVPRLLVREGTVELPLWAWQGCAPRQRVFVTPQGTRLELHTEGARIAALPRDMLARAEAHTRPWPSDAEGWRLRPRALALSAFARLLLADLFVHGIGGAKYDELMEDWIAGLLRVEPRPMACVSATLRLPLMRSEVRPADVTAARHAARDLRFNPERHLKSVPEELRREKQELVRRAALLRAERPKAHVDRRVVFREIRRVNEQMLAGDPWRAAEYDQRVQTLEAHLELDRVALEREYFYALHTPEALGALAQAIRAAV